MGARRNIKDAETIRLARKLAEAMGHPVSQAIPTALEREIRESESTCEVPGTRHAILPDLPYTGDDFAKTGVIAA